MRLAVRTKLANALKVHANTNRTTSAHGESRRWPSHLVNSQLSEQTVNYKKEKEREEKKEREVSALLPLESCPPPALPIYRMYIVRSWFITTRIGEAPVRSTCPNTNEVSRRIPASSCSVYLARR